MAPLREGIDAFRLRLAELSNEVALLLFTGTTETTASQAASAARQLLDDVAQMNGRIRVEVVDTRREAQWAAAFGITHTPAIAVLTRGRDTRMRFLGAPAGCEFASLVEAVAVAGGNGSGLSPVSRRLVAEHVTTALDILVFVTPTCAACSRTVQVTHRLAYEHPLIHATCIDATEFVDLAQLHRVNGVPTIVVNGASGLLGTLDDDALVEAIVRPRQTKPD